MLDPETIDNMSREERSDLLAWLEDLVKYVKLKLGIATDAKPESTGQVSDDPVGDIVIQEHKHQQAKSMSGRKASGWVSVGFNKEADDRHV